MSTVKKSLNDVVPVSDKDLAQLKAKQGRGDIDFSDVPELDAAFWDNATVKLPDTKQGVYIRLDADVLSWLKGYGKGYQTRINAILRSYYETYRDEPRPKN